MYVDGGVDDDVSFNGEVYEDGVYCFWGEGCTADETPCSYVNGAHTFSYTQTLEDGESVTIKGVDNGGGGSIHCEISFKE